MSILRNDTVVCKYESQWSYKRQDFDQKLQELLKTLLLTSMQYNTKLVARIK